MATVVSQTEQRVVLYDVSWATYELLLADHLDSSSPHFTYDEGTLEIVKPSMEHEETNRSIATLVELVAEEWEIDLMNLGSTTCKREDLKRGFEPDTCFYFQNAKRIRGKDEIDLHIDPPPDLVIEIDITSGSVDKLPIYAAFGVSEVWRYSSKLFMIFKLDADRYIKINESLALPGLIGDVIYGFIQANRKLKRLAWMKRIHEWARDHRPS